MLKRKKRRNDRYSYTTRRPPKSGRGAKIAAMVTIPVATVIGGGAMLSLYADVESIGEDFCYARSDQAQSVIFVDHSFTHDMSDAQFRDLRTAFAREYDAAPANGRVSVYTTSALYNGSLPRPVFTGCRPAATQAEQEAIGAPSKPAPYLRNQAEDAEAAFLEAVDAVLEDARDPATAAGDSPILEQLQGISRDPDFQGAERTLTVITDGIQNSETARFCAVRGDMPSFASFSTRTAYQHVEPDSFAGVDVRFLLVEFGQLPGPGLEHCTNDELRTWWPDYFEANGADGVQRTVLRYWTQ